MKTRREYGRRRIGGLSIVPSRAGQWQRRTVAFSLIELLVVISIMAILAVIAVPVMSGFGKSNAIAAADRQLLDDLSLARAKAIAGHTTVYMVFVPQNIDQLVKGANPGPSVATAQQIAPLYGGQYTTYALLSLRTVGDQPGRPTARYLTGWRKLPDGVFFATNKFMFSPPITPYVPGPYVRSFQRDISFPFPYIGSNQPIYINLPYVAFDYLGRLVIGPNDLQAQDDEYLPMARGSVFFARDNTNGVIPDRPVMVHETPVNNSVTISNVIHIDALSGRARIIKQELQ